jgi:hypothetical protein
MVGFAVCLKVIKGNIDGKMPKNLIDAHLNPRHPLPVNLNWQNTALQKVAPRTGHGRYS